MKDLNYYKNKASENYAETTLEVLTYIENLENKLEEAINYTRCCEELKREKCNMCNEEKDCQGHAVCEDCGGRSF